MLTYEQNKPQEIIDLGEKIYEEQIRDKVEPHLKGMMVVIDVNSGDYEIDVEDAKASLRLLKRRPDAVIYGVRAGYKAVVSLGGFEGLPER